MNEEMQVVEMETVMKEIHLETGVVGADAVEDGEAQVKVTAKESTVSKETSEVTSPKANRRGENIKCETSWEKWR